MNRVQRAGPRCLACGRRFAGPHPRCAVEGDGEAVERDCETAERDGAAPRWPELPGYRIEALLGAGGFGAVYLAAPAAGGWRVAIKVAAENALAAERLQREGEALALIGSPHVPALIGTGTLGDGRPYLVMEHVAMPLLSARLAELPGPM